MYKMEVSHNVMGSLDQKKFWSHGTILGYLGTPLGTLGYLYTLEIFFFYNNLLSSEGKLKKLPYKIKGLNFSWCWKPFLATQFLKMAQNVADMFWLFN